MRSIILHGDEQVKSRQRLQEIILEAKSRGWDITRLDGATVSRGELLTSGRARGLLATNQLLVIENLLSSNSKAIDAIPELSGLDGVSVVIWERKKVDGRKLRKFQKEFKIELFQIPQTIFSFLDSLSPGNARASLTLLHRVPPQERERILYMLGFRIRQLILASEEPEALTLPGWQRGKLSAQAKRWELTGLYNVHSTLLDLDRRNKRSQLPENLASSLDLLVARL